MQNQRTVGQSIEADRYEDPVARPVLSHTMDDQISGIIYDV